MLVKTYKYILIISDLQFSTSPMHTAILLALFVLVEWAQLEVDPASIQLVLRLNQQSGPDVMMDENSTLSIECIVNVSPSDNLNGKQYKIIISRNIKSPLALFTWTNNKTNKDVELHASIQSATLPFK